MSIFQPTIFNMSFNDIYFNITGFNNGQTGAKVYSNIYNYFRKDGANRALYSYPNFNTTAGVSTYTAPISYLNDLKRLSQDVIINSNEFITTRRVTGVFAGLYSSIFISQNGITIGEGISAATTIAGAVNVGILLTGITLNNSAMLINAIDYNLVNNTLPNLNTTEITNITTTTADSGAWVFYPGYPGQTITQNGLCYSTSPTPTTANTVITTTNSGGGRFSITMTGLTSSTTYYVRSFATNSIGTAYGGQQTFTTL